MTRGIHTLPNNGHSNEWLTPPEILNHLGHFDLDPCAPINRPWDTAEKHYTENDNGLILPWQGRVWLNPPYGSATELWLRKMSEHFNGIALVAARVETEWFHDHIWKRSTCMLFLRGRLHFRHVDGSRARGNAGHGSVLVAYGYENTKILRNCGIPGTYIGLNRMVIDTATDAARRLAQGVMAFGEGKE